LSEPPAWDYEISEIVEKTQEALEEERVPFCLRAVELFFLIGARHYYGGIAVTFTPTQKGELVVKVPLSAGVGLARQWTITCEWGSSWKHRFIELDVP